MDALRLRRMTIPIKLIAEHGDDNDQAAERQKKHVVTTYMSLLRS